MWRWVVPVGAGVLAAWRPFEVDPLSGVVVAGLLVLAVVIGNGVGPRFVGRPPAGPVLSALWIAVGMAVGWSRAQGVATLALAATVLLVILVVARAGPPERGTVVLALGISLLTLWAVWQVAVGFRVDLQELGRTTLPAPWAVRHRLETARAFASQLHPGHLAVLLAMVVPLGIGAIRDGHRRLGAVVTFLAGAGVLLTRSPLGVVLALGASLAVFRKESTRWWLAVAGLLVAVLGAVALTRPDLARWEPFVHRWQNWTNAVWVWTESPVTGAGLGGFGTAALAVPFPVGNHPQHAHSLPLEWLAEMGVPGLVFAGYLFWWIVSLARRVRAGSPGLAAAILVVPLHNLVDFSFFASGVVVPWAVLVGWSLALTRDGDDDSTGSPPRRAPAAVALAAVVFAFWAASGASAALESWVAHPAGGPAPNVERLRLARRLAPWRSGPLEAILGLAVRNPAFRETGLEECRRAGWWWPRSPGIAASAARLAAAADLPWAWAREWEARALGPVHHGGDEAMPAGGLPGAGP